MPNSDKIEQISIFLIIEHLTDNTVVVDYMTPKINSSGSPGGSDFKADQDMGWWRRLQQARKAWWLDKNYEELEHADNIVAVSKSYPGMKYFFKS